MLPSSRPPWGVDITKFADRDDCPNPAFSVYVDTSRSDETIMHPQRSMIVTGFNSINLGQLVEHAKQSGVYIKLGWAPLCVHVVLEDGQCFKETEAATLDNEDVQKLSNLRQSCYKISTVYPHYEEPLKKIASILAQCNAPHRGPESSGVRMEPQGTSLVVVASSFGVDNLIGMECLSRLTAIQVKTPTSS